VFIIRGETRGGDIIKRGYYYYSPTKIANHLRVATANYSAISKGRQSRKPVNYSSTQVFVAFWEPSRNLASHWLWRMGSSGDQGIPKTETHLMQGRSDPWKVWSKQCFPCSRRLYNHITDDQTSYQRPVHLGMRL